MKARVRWKFVMTSKVGIFTRFESSLAKASIPEAMVASESVAIQASGFTFAADVRPGEAGVFDVRDRVLHPRQVSTRARHNPCLFEIVYLARPDSIMDGISVYKSRLRMGDALARKILKLRPEHKIDVVIPVGAHKSTLKFAGKL